MKLSIPISLKVLKEEGMSKILADVLACKAERVFICLMSSVLIPGVLSEDRLQQARVAVETFRAAGLEVGFWIDTLGHGAPLVGDFEAFPKDRYASLTGAAGDQPPTALCPLDENLLEDYAAAVTKLAQLGPDIIMTDDDLRITRASRYYFGCFCDKHLELFYKEVGERVPREELPQKILTGGPSKYRDAYLKIQAQGLNGFVARVRQAIDAVDSNIRFALCVTAEMWDATGLHMPDFVRLAAGNTQPLMRTYGAAYWRAGLHHVIECTRHQCFVLQGTDIEMMAEGDVYPRPRYNVPSRVLELFYYALIADGNCKGMLGYVTDYHQKPGYEDGYINRHIKNEPLRQGVEELFEGKKAVGVYLHHEEHLVRNWVLPDTHVPGVADRLTVGHKPASHDMLTDNSIPSVFAQGEYPCLMVGENARTATAETLKNGAILDATAAMILAEKGIDTGILSCEAAEYLQERYLAADDAIPNMDCGALRRITCKETAKILSRFEDGSPASYTYENAQGNRFYVIAFDHFFTNHGGEPRKNFLNNYYRQADLMAAIEWMCGKKLPVKCPKNPSLYVYTAKKDGAMSVLLLNLHMDSIDPPVLELDKEYTSIKTVNCTGTLEGNRVVLSELHPYSMAAFEVR